MRLTTMRPSSKVFVLYVAAWLWVAIASQSSAKQWATGDEFREALNRTVGITWSATPIRDALATVADSQNVAIFLDRRVDPSLLVNSQSALGPLSKTLSQALRESDLGVGFVGPVIYVGPKQTAARIATLAELRNEATQAADVTIRKAFTQRVPLEWEEQSEPKAIAAGLAARAGLKFGNLSVIPHDVWLSADLPPLTLSESLTLVLAGFSMNFTLDNEDDELRLMVTRFPIGVSMERQYRLGTDSETSLERIRTQLPQATVKQDEKNRSNFAIRSLLEDHWQLEEWLTPVKPIGRSRSNSAATNRRRPKRGTNATAKQVYTLKVENKPAGKVIEILAEQIGMKATFANGTEKLRKQLVSFSVKDASAKELLSAAASEASLRIEIDGKAVSVLPQ